MEGRRGEGIAVVIKPLLGVITIILLVTAQAPIGEVTLWPIALASEEIKPAREKSEGTKPAEKEEAWTAMVKEAFKGADVVLIGRVRGIRSYLATDGGLGYDIEVSEVFKGEPVKQVSFRAGGWAHVIRYEIGERVLLFLRESKAFLPKDKYVFLQDRDNQPIALKVQDDVVVGISGQAKSEWGKWALDKYISLLKRGQDKKE
ncbi:MAG: hypothetical protein ACK4WF_01970 [Candidatus Brocadiales bacterium]